MKESLSGEQVMEPQAMTVTQLIEHLNQFNGDLKVFINDGRYGVMELEKEMVINDFKLEWVNGKKAHGQELVMINPMMVI